MNHVIHNSIVNFIWGIADDVLRDVYVRGKYRDVILPMTVIRRLDALLEPSKEKVLGMKKQLDGAGIANQHAAAYQNAMKNNDKKTARIEHDAALQRVMIDLLSDHTELFKQFGDNPSFKKRQGDTIFGVTYQQQAKQSATGASYGR